MTVKNKLGLAKNEGNVDSHCRSIFISFIFFDDNCVFLSGKSSPNYMREKGLCEVSTVVMLPSSLGLTKLFPPQWKLPSSVRQDLRRRWFLNPLKRAEERKIVMSRCQVVKFQEISNSSMRSVDSLINEHKQLWRLV